MPVAPPEPEPTAPDRPPFTLGLGAYVQGRGYGAAAPFLLGGGAEATARFGDGPWHPGVSLLFAYQGPVSGEGRYATISLQALSFRLLPSLRTRLGRVELELGLGGGLDALIARSTSEQVSGPRLLAERLDAAPFFTAAVGLRFRLTEASAIFVRAVVDLDPARRRYVTSVAQDREYLLVPWQARPALQLGFSFDLFARTP